MKCLLYLLHERISFHTYIHTCWLMQMATVFLAFYLLSFQKKAALCTGACWPLSCSGHTLSHTYAFWAYCTYTHIHTHVHDAGRTLSLAHPLEYNCALACRFAYTHTHMQITSDWLCVYVRWPTRTSVALCFLISFPFLFIFFFHFFNAYVLF